MAVEVQNPSDCRTQRCRSTCPYARPHDTSYTQSFNEHPYRLESSCLGQYAILRVREREAPSALPTKQIWSARRNPLALPFMALNNVTITAVDDVPPQDRHAQTTI